MSRTGRSERREIDGETDRAVAISGSVNGRVEARSM